MTLHKAEKPRKGLYSLEIQEFLASGYDSAWTDLYENKTPQSRLVGFKNAVQMLGAPVRVSIQDGKIWLEKR